MKITAALLKRKRACSSQVALFEELFPNDVEVTEAVCVSVADKFNWDWAAQNLLSASASAEYERVCAPASAEYERVRASASAEYERVTAQTFGRLAETSDNPK